VPLDSARTFLHQDNSVISVYVGDIVTWQHLLVEFREILKPK
jgi:hypothetical protein